MEIAVNEDWQHINTDLGDIPFEPWAWQIVIKQIVNAASQYQDILLSHTGWLVLSIKNVNTSTLVWGSYPLNLEHWKWCKSRLPTQHHKIRIYFCFLLGGNCCQWRLASHQHWFGGHTFWTLSMTNSDQADCQRCIAISGYTSFSYWVASAVDQEFQHVNTGLGVIPLEPWALKMV